MGRIRKGKKGLGGHNEMGSIDKGNIEESKKEIESDKQSRLEEVI